MSKKSAKRAQTLKIPRIIIITAKLFSLVSTRLLVRFCARLFTTPIRHKMPKRELAMDRDSVKENLLVAALSKTIVSYRIGTGSQKVLLVHGWSGRGTQLVKFAELLTSSGYLVYSFDAPAHGKSPGNTTLLPEFVECILQMERSYGPFEAAIGHSLGGMALLNAVKRGLKINRLVTIGSGDIIKDIFDDFIRRLELKPETSDRMRAYFEAKYGGKMEDYSSYLSAQKTDIPVLVIHDENDAEVPVKCAHHIVEHLKEGELMLTQKLGHRKILGDLSVIERAIAFIQNQIP